MWEFVQDVPLVGGPEAQEAIDLCLSCPPGDSQVEVERLVLGARTGHGLEEHRESSGTSRWQVDAVTTGGGQGAGHGRPKFGKRGWILGLHVDRTKGDLMSRHDCNASRTPDRLPFVHALDDVQHEDVRKGSFGMLFSKQYWRATLFISGFWFCAVTPYFAIATFADSVLNQYGLAGGLAGGVGLSAVALAGVVVTFLVIDKAGRRILTVPPQWLCAVVLAIIGLWAGAPGPVVLTLFLVFSFFNAMYNALTGVYPSEVLPTEIRGIGTGFAAAVSRVGAGMGIFLMPMAMENLGPGPTMLIAAGVACAGAGLSQWLAPETKGKSLTETAAGYSH